MKLPEGAGTRPSGTFSVSAVRTDPVTLHQHVVRRQRGITPSNGGAQE